MITFVWYLSEEINYMELWWCGSLIYEIIITNIVLLRLTRNVFSIIYQSPYFIIIGRVLLFSAVHYGTNSRISQKLVFFIFYTATMSYFVLQTRLLKQIRWNNLLISFNTEHRNVLCRRLTRNKMVHTFCYHISSHVLCNFVHTVILNIAIILQEKRKNKIDHQLLLICWNNTHFVNNSLFLSEVLYNMGIHGRLGMNFAVQSIVSSEKLKQFNFFTKFNTKKKYPFIVFQTSFSICTQLYWDRV
jgi:hypothetical protein